MQDGIYIEPGKSIHSATDNWYRNIQVLGMGGNAVTFLVMCTSGVNKGVLFALKVFKRLSDPERASKFLAEAKFLTECDHPAVMRTFDEGEFIGRPFLVAEYLPRTLADVMHANESIIAKLSYATQLISALTYLDGLAPSVVHRDIKPRNIFVKGRSCVLGDFGLMKRVGPSAAGTPDVFKESVGVGMPYLYRTPDLVSYAKNESPISTASDVFQLGLVLAELFSGRNPSRRADDMLDPVELDPISHIPSPMGGQIVTVLQRMLLPDPESRDGLSLLSDRWLGLFQSAAEAAWLLEARVL